MAGTEGCCLTACVITLHFFFFLFFLRETVLAIETLFEPACPYTAELSIGLPALLRPLCFFTRLQRGFTNKKGMFLQVPSRFFEGLSLLLEEHRVFLLESINSFPSRTSPSNCAPLRARPFLFIISEQGLINIFSFLFCDFDSCVTGYFKLSQHLLFKARAIYDTLETLACRHNILLLDQI